MQQRLMVAALSCGESQSYNNFVRSYQTELQASDKNLQTYFRRVNGKTGTADYHAYKTRLANSSSMAVINDMTGYCASAKASFEQALERQARAGGRSSPIQTLDQRFVPCPIQTASTATSPLRRRLRRREHDRLNGPCRPRAAASRRDNGEVVGKRAGVWPALFICASGWRSRPAPPSARRHSGPAAHEASTRRSGRPCSRARPGARRAA